MKIRTGFVSNSSSSSFILAFKRNGEPCKHCGRKDTDLWDLFNHHNTTHSDDTEAEAMGRETVISFLRKEWEWLGKDKIDELVKKVNEAPKDFEVMVGSLSYHDDLIRETINGMKVAGTVKMLYFDGE